MKIAVINNNIINYNLIDDNYDQVIYIEKGYLMDQNIKNNNSKKFLVGDFDTFAIDEYQIDNQIKIIKLNPEKDLSDTEYVLENMCAKADEIHLFAHNGGRIDHSYTMFNYLKKYANLTIFDNYNKYFLLQPGNHALTKLNYRYISFLGLSDVQQLSLIDFKYELENYDLNENDSLCISNEFIKNSAQINFKKGKLMVVYANDIK